MIVYKIIIFVNSKDLFHFSYQRYIENIYNIYLKQRRKLIYEDNDDGDDKNNEKILLNFG